MKARVISPLASLDTPHFQVLSHHRVSTLPSKEKREIGKEKKNNWGDANFVFIFLPKKSSGEKGKEFILRQAGTKKKRIKSLRLVCYNFPAHKCLFFRKFTPGSLGPKRTSSGDYIEKTSSLGGGEVEQTFHCFTLPPNAPFRPLFLILFFFSADEKGFIDSNRWWGTRDAFSRAASSFSSQVRLLPSSFYLESHEPRPGKLFSSGDCPDDNPQTWPLSIDYQNSNYNNHPCIGRGNQS